MMLTACASAGPSLPNLADLPAPSHLQIDRRLFCPAEIMIALPDRVSPPAGAVLRVNEEADAYLEARARREDVLEAAVRDAQAACERERAGQ